MTQLFLVDAALAAHSSDAVVDRRDGWVAVRTPGDPSPSSNEVLYCRRDASFPALRDEAEAFFGPGVRYKWTVAPDARPSGLGAALEAAGFEGWDVAALSVPTSLALTASEGVEVTPVRSDAQLDVFIATHAEGWAASEAQRQLWRRALGRNERCALFTATVDGQPAGTAYSLLLPDAGCGYLGGAQVLARFRGRGAYRALIAARLHDLAARGLPRAITLARAATSAPRLTRWGFEVAFRYRIFQSP